MNKNTPLIVAGISVITAVVCLASTISFSARHRADEQKIAALLEQIARTETDGRTTGAPAAKAVSSVEGTDELQSIRARLAEKEAELATLQTGTATPTNAPPQKRESWEERMARMKEEDPEGYAEMIRRKEEWQQKMRYNLAERTATFMDLDTTRMNRKELANHELLVEKMARIWELSEQFQDPEVEPNREAMQELFKAVHETRPLMDQERTVMFKQLGAEIGYEGKDAKEFATHIEDIIDSTTIQMPRGGGRGGGGR